MNFYAFRIKKYIYKNIFSASHSLHLHLKRISSLFGQSIIVQAPNLHFNEENVKNGS